MDKLKSLCEVKKIIAIMLAVVFCYMAIIGRVSAEQFIVIFSSVIGAYFSQSAVRQAINEYKSNEPVTPKKIDPTSITNNIK